MNTFTSAENNSSGDTCTLRDLAEKSGFSLATVSYALRNHPRISKATQDKILLTAKVLGYRPNPLVTNLMAQVRGRKVTRRDECIAFISSVGLEEHWRFGKMQKEIFHGASEQAQRHGFYVEEFRLDTPSVTPKKLGRILCHRGIRGVFIAPRPDFWRLDDFPWDKFSSVTVGFTLRSPQLHRVVNNHYALIRRGLEKLFSIGRSRIGMVLAKNTDERTQFQLTSALYPEICYKTGGIHILPPLIVRDYSGQYDTIREWLLCNKPDAIISDNRRVADIAADLGMKIPADLIFVDLIPDTPDPSIPALLADHHTIGMFAVDALMGQLQRNAAGITSERKTILSEGKLYFPTTADFQIVP
jgi:LacI family transcriptional regulator